MKIFSIILIIIILGFGGYFLLNNTDDEITDTSVITDTENLAPNTEVPNAEVVIVYSDSGYSPANVNVKVGTIVTYKNESSLSMWPASAKHPTHSGYPTTGGCLGSTFDACRGVLPGESWSFQFDIAGEWAYHDHLKPSYFGKIVVE